MKKLLLFLAAALVIQSCSNNGSSSSANIVKEDTTQVVASKELAIDTLQIGQYTFLVYPLSHSSFPLSKDSLEWEYQDREVEMLKNDSSIISRSKDSLMMKLTNGKILTLVSSKEDEEENYLEYNYKAYEPDLGYFLMSATYFEALDYIYASRSTGDTLHAWGMPVTSPDKKWIMCSSMDLVAGFVSNGFQFFTFNKGRIEHAGEIELDGWAARRVKWLDNKTLEVERVSIINENMDQRVEAVKMVMQ